MNFFMVFYGVFHVLAASSYIFATSGGGGGLLHLFLELFDSIHEQAVIFLDPCEEYFTGGLLNALLNANHIPGLLISDLVLYAAKERNDVEAKFSECYRTFAEKSNMRPLLVKFGTKKHSSKERYLYSRSFKFLILEVVPHYHFSSANLVSDFRLINQPPAKIALIWIDNMEALNNIIHILRFLAEKNFTKTSSAEYLQHLQMKKGQTNGLVPYDKAPIAKTGKHRSTSFMKHITNKHELSFEIVISLYLGVFFMLIS
ncbi:hypothetical protein ENBRE01_2112 [Enteropsectra breve]|nr:hypothetical protein ENBRE01_2112 [Enteropsectra breve]